MGGQGSCMKRLKENIPYGDTISTKHKNDHKAVLQKNYLHCVSIVVVLRARQTTRDGWGHSLRPGRAIGTYIIKTESKLYFIIK